MLAASSASASTTYSSTTFGNAMASSSMLSTPTKGETWIILQLMAPTKWFTRSPFINATARQSEGHSTWSNQTHCCAGSLANASKSRLGWRAKSGWVKFDELGENVQTGTDGKGTGISKSTTTHNQSSANGT